MYPYPPRFEVYEKELDLPLYSLTEKKNIWKSTFVDSNRPDTVQPAIIKKFDIEEFISSDNFYKMIFERCYKASKNDNKIVSLSCDLNDEIKSYLINFFVGNKLGVIVNKTDNGYYLNIEIKFRLNKNITFEDICNVYISELKRINLSDEDIKGKKLKLKKKINNGEN